MLEGKELQGPIGKYGEYSVDLDSQLNLVASVGVKVDLIAEAEKIVAGKPLLEKLLGLIKAAVGRA